MPSAPQVFPISIRTVVRDEQGLSLQLWVRQKVCPTNLRCKICHVSLKFKYFCITRQWRCFFIKLFLTSLVIFAQTWSLLTFLFLFSSTIFAKFHDHCQSDTIYSPTPLPVRRHLQSDARDVPDVPFPSPLEMNGDCSLALKWVEWSPPSLRPSPSPSLGPRSRRGGKDFATLLLSQWRNWITSPVLTSSWAIEKRATAARRLIFNDFFSPRLQDKLEWSCLVVTTTSIVYD